MHPTMSLGIATMNVKGKKVRVGEDVVSPGAAWAWKDLMAHLKKVEKQRVFLKRATQDNQAVSMQILGNS